LRKSIRIGQRVTHRHVKYLSAVGKKVQCLRQDAKTNI